MDGKADIGVDLAGRRFRLLGEPGVVAEAVSAALLANGAVAAAAGQLPELLIVAYPLLPEADTTDTPLLRLAGETAGAMQARGSGRVVFLLSALAALPMRRHPGYSAAMAAAAAGMRGLAMQFGPQVLVNAVGAGALENDAGTLLAGDRHMLTHAGLGRPGGLADLTNAVLFLSDPANSYTTGQVLVVDGGWSIGYGRNF